MIYLTHHFLEKSCYSHPNKEAVVHAKKRYTYRQIEDKANKLANWLLDTDFQPGDRVAILVRNSIEYIVSYYGILKAGGITVPLNTGLQNLEILQLLADSQSKFIITEKYFAYKINPFLNGHGIILKMMVIVDGEAGAELQNLPVETFKSIFHYSSNARPSCSIIDQDFASIIYTSGSTGKPKGVVLKHINIVSNTKSIISYLNLQEDERCLCILPFFYVFGKSLLNTHVAVAATIILDNRFTFPNAVLKTLIEEKATSFSGVPSTFSILLNRSAMSQMSFPNLRYITQAGGHMPDKAKRELIACFPDKKIYIMYGATEASPRLSFMPPQVLPDKINSIGKPIPNVAMKVVDEAGEEVERGMPGEIVAKGSNIMHGYWNEPEATGKVLRGGWYWTGDMGYCDGEGYFYVTRRKRDLVKIGMYKVSTKEVEDVLFRFDGICEAAVIGVPDENLGESLVAFIVPRENETCSLDSLAEFCRQHLPRYKIPSRFILAASLPKNEAGKISKLKLLQEYELKH